MTQFTRDNNVSVINLFGGPSSGKSTTSAGLFYHMKLKQHSVELVTEYAKDLVYSKQIELLLDQQEYIFTEQNWRLHRLRDQVEWAITDSPLMLSHVYVNDTWSCAQPFKDLVTATFNTYTNYNFFLQRPVAFEDYGRRHDYEQSLEIDNQIHTVLKDQQIPYQLISVGGDNNPLEQIYTYVTGQNL